jgi:hypothetical protein
MLLPVEVAQKSSWQQIVTARTVFWLHCGSTQILELSKDFEKFAAINQHLG